MERPVLSGFLKVSLAFVRLCSYSPEGIPNPGATKHFNLRRKT